MKIIKEIYQTTGTNNKILLVDKDIGETSHDVVDQIRKIYKTRRVGHAGTLDPFASGLLLIGVEGGTKLIWQFEDQHKGYYFKFVIGIKTPSGDHQEEIVAKKTSQSVPEEKIRDIFKTFPRSYYQQVPILSSVKVNGQKLRELYRSSHRYVEDGDIASFYDSKGNLTTIQIPQKLVEIPELELAGIFESNKSEMMNQASSRFIDSLNSADIPSKFQTIKGICTVSKGTYIRALVQDIAAKFEQFATLISLRRYKVGDFTIPLDTNDTEASQQNI